MPRTVFSSEGERKAAQRAAGKRYYLRNREKLLLKSKEWKRRNPKKKRSEMSAEEVQRAREYKKRWYAKNSERCAALQRARRADKNGAQAKSRKAHYLKNKQRILAQTAEYARRHPEMRKQIQMRSLDKNRAKRYEDWGCREAMRRGCVIGDRDAVREVYQRAIDLSKETGVRWSVDHIIPLGLGGAHSIENVQAMLHDLNQIKSGNPFWICENGEYKDWRDVPFSTWPDKFLKIYNAVASYVESGRPFYSMTA